MIQKIKEDYITYILVSIMAFIITLLLTPIFFTIVDALKNYLKLLLEMSDNSAIVIIVFVVIFLITMKKMLKLSSD